jgi:uncharacterized tellurite resistance protein B-like protein
MPLMNRDERRLAFVKALIIAAWADGELSSDEITTLSHYLQRLEISNEEYEQLRPLLENPIRAQAARTMLEDQLRLLDSPEDQRTLVAAVGDLLVGDDKLDPSETAFLQELRSLTSHVPTAHLFVSRLRALWSTPAPASHGAGRRNELVGQFLQKRLLEYFRGRIALIRARSGLPVEDGVSDRDLYRAVIWAGLLSRVAEADRSFCPAEEQELLQLLSAAGDVPRPDLEVIVRAFREGTLAEVDLGALVREFVQLASAEEGGVLLDCLFLVAAADGELHDAEVDVIRQIAQGAGFPESSFASAWERCRQRMASGWN